MKFFKFIISLFSSNSKTISVTREEEKVDWYVQPIQETPVVTEEEHIEPFTEETHLAPETNVVTSESKPKKKKPYRRKPKKTSNSN
jgi:hypothetical protein